jgi:hypothetical protein
LASGIARGVSREARLRVAMRSQPC